jgi:uncharacterized coiled-coil DUF342 family protein
MDSDILKFAIWFCFGGWCLYLSSERARIVSDIKEIKEKADKAFTKAETLATIVMTTYLTKEEHKDFDNRISTSIDKLSDRIDKAIQTMVAK